MHLLNSNHDSQEAWHITPTYNCTLGAATPQKANRRNEVGTNLAPMRRTLHNYVALNVPISALVSSS